MESKVVNVKIKYIYANLKEWVDNVDENVYIGRRGIVFVNRERFPKVDSIWCNPFKIGRDGNSDEIINKYREYIKDKIKGNSSLYDIEKLRGKNLGCWCVTKEEKCCHGNVLLELLE